MAKSNTCELCGLPDNSYKIEDDEGNVLRVCKLCYDGYNANNPEAGDPASETAGAKPETLTAEQMAQLLKSGSSSRRKSGSSAHRQAVNEERRKIDAAVKRAVAAKVEQTLAADTEDITRELLETKAEIEEEERRNNELQAAQTEEHAAAQSDTLPEALPPAEETAIAETENRNAALTETTEEQDKSALRVTGGTEVAHNENEARIKLAEEKLLAAIHLAANPTIDDERIKITSPEVELAKDTRLKTNLDVATEGHAGSIKFLHAFKYVLHPVTYAVFAGLSSLAVFTALMIIAHWKVAVIDLAACVGAVVCGALLVWYLKRRLEVDKRTVLLRIRQEQILFDSMAAPCYRELKTKYPMIKALAWLLGRLSVILPVTVIIGGTAAGIITTFMFYWWLVAPVILGSVLAAVVLYYLFKFAADLVQYKLDIERNQQISEQSLLDILSKNKRY